MDAIAQLKGKLIVSCQAYPGEPMLDPNTMAQVAESAVRGGAAAIRAKGLDDLRAIRQRVDVPLIGLVKVGTSGVYITPTLKDCIEVAETGCEIIAIDGTRRERPDGRTLAETITEFKAQFPDVLVMADCGSEGDAMAAEAAGADLIGTTLVGYSGERPKTKGVDWDAVDQIVAAVDRPVLVEGRVHSPEAAVEAIRRGAWSVVVGTAITHPATITGWFAEAVDNAG
ncbi:N-acetylmannosamine-6-phosphate 2-epimerase [Tessaracoccus sp. MC1865]|uniref:N-acetylmannosamine-6-phosphate 2-epimerase n=1 Tax=Tessaracoccus sp. MC1865 TaxID=2760310 RepID=UPI0015FFA462|nr:N-acetylmannosamine-6-phosphate 2-epimerase [Tessaracoccus sp. MC1865]MBB1484167.1 N-acetylmannosamine-6-phosphate 2-epimerase [Tessaracoccus sp. MC1865]QTO37191.1 N-acetylmannosamine-6-phosphate 2-epimerase [Tessaracoccus sp. MC1865]